MSYKFILEVIPGISEETFPVSSSWNCRGDGATNLLGLMGRPKQVSRRVVGLLRESYFRGVILLI